MEAKKKYTVHVYHVVRVAVSGVEAGSQIEAIRKADEIAPGPEEMFNDPCPKWPSIKSIEYADDVDGYLVDEEGDENYRFSTFYTSDLKPMHEDAHCTKCGK